MLVADRVLLAFSRSTEEPDLSNSQPEWSVNTALDPLFRVLPASRALIPNANVLDVGCGSGHQAVAFAIAGARCVTALDTNPRILPLARQLADEYHVADRVRITSRIDPSEQFDVVFSQNSMEHFVHAEDVLAMMVHATHPGGRVVISFGPPWLAPYGAHMRFFTRVPWVHLLFPERVVMRVRSRYRQDGAMRYEDVEGGLGRMSVGRFERMIARSGLVMEDRYDLCVKGMSWFRFLPGVRELMINHVACILRKPEPG